MLAFFRWVSPGFSQTTVMEKHFRKSAADTFNANICWLTANWQNYNKQLTFVQMIVGHQMSLLPANHNDNQIYDNQNKQQNPNNKM